MIEMTRRELVRGLAAGTVVAMTGPALSGCRQNPALGRDQLLFVSDGQLAALAAGTWRKAVAATPRSRDPRVPRVGERIVEAARTRFPHRGLGDHDWEFVVFDDDQVNAWVLPGGKVGFYTGILDIMENEDQVATVMGHEVGHVVGRHAAERFSQRLLAQGALIGVGVALSQADTGYADEIAAVLGAGVTFGVLLPYSRKHEYEADRLGIDFMMGGGYAPREALRFWDSMARRSDGKGFEFMSTHPSDANRIAAMRQHLGARGAA